MGDEGTVDVTINSSDSAADFSARVLLAGDANLNVTSGSGDDEIYIDGSGNNVINAGAGADKIVLGSGNDIVVIKDGQFANGSSIEGGEGTNTVRVAGTNDLTTGTLSNIQNVLLDADAVATLDEDQLADVDSIVVTDGAELSINDVAGTTDTLDLTDVLSGSLGSLTIASGVTVALSADQIANIAEFTNNGTIVTDEAGAQLLADRDVENFEIDGGDFTLENAVTEDAAAQSDLSYTVSTDAEQAFDQLYLDGVAEDQLADDGASVEITSVATVAQAVEFEAGGLAIEGSYAVADTAANIAASLINGSAAWLNADDISSLTITDAGSVSDITEIFKAGGSLQTAVAAAKADDSDDLVITLPEYTLADTAAHLAAAASDDVVQDAQSITLTNAATVAQAKTLIDSAANLIDGGYSLNDSASALYAATSAVRNGATDITVNTPASVVQAIRIDGFNNSGETSFDLQDGALQLVNAPVSLLEQAGEVTFTNGATTELTVAQATKLAPYLADDIGFVLNDSSANLTSEDGLALIEQFDSVQILPTTALTLDQVQTLVDLTPTNLQPSDVAIEDTAENLLAAIAPTETVDALGNSTVAQSADADTAEALIDNVISGASTVTATGDITIEQATQLLDTNVGNPAIDYSLADTAENLAANQTEVEGADSVTLTDTATAAQAETLAGFSNADDIDYAIADSYAGLAAVIEQTNGALTTDSGNDALLAATSITLTDEAGSIAQVRDIVALNAALEDAGKASLDYAIADSVGNLPKDETVTADMALLSGATSVTVAGAGADIQAYADDTATDGLFAQVDSYEIIVGSDADSSALSNDITAAGSYYDGAEAISVNTADLTVANAAADYDLLVTDNNADKLSFADISDSVANLLTEDASEIAALGQSASVTVTDTATVAQANAIAALAGGELVLDGGLSDTVANLLTAGELLSSLGGGNLVATDAASVEQYQALLEMIGESGVSLDADISDTITAVQSASPELLASLGDNDITLQAGNEVALSAAQAAELSQTGGTLTDILAEDEDNGAVTYEVVDSIENLINAMDDSSTLGTVLTEASNITATSGVVIPNDYLADLQTLVTARKFDTLNSSYSISGEATTLVGGSVDDAISNADVVTVTDAATVSQIQTIQGMNADVEVSFDTISDSLSNLLIGDEFVSEEVAEIVAQAGSVTVTDGTLTVAEAQSLVDLLGSDVEVSYQLEDTAENLANADELLANATLVDVTADFGKHVRLAPSHEDDTTLAQFQAILDGVIQDNVDYGIDLVDTAENLLQATPAMIAVLDGESDNIAKLAAGETATIEQATTIEELLGGNVDLTAFNIVDTAEALAAYQAGGDDLDTDFASVTATTTFTLAQAADVSGQDVDTAESVTGTALTNEVVVEDSYANLVNGDASGFTKAAQVIVDGAVNVSKAVQIATAYVDSGSMATQADALAGMDFAIEDSLTYTIAAFEEDNAVLGAADSVTVDGVGEINLYAKGATNYLLGSADELSQYPQALLDVGYVIEDTVANYLAAADFASADAAQGYILEDTSTNVLETSVSTALSADEIQITDVIDAATLQDLQGLGINLTEVAGVSDSAANLAGLTLSAVTVTTVTDAAITQAQADAIDGLGEGDVFSLADDYDSLNMTDVANAQAVTVNDAITAAEAGTIYDENANVTLSVVDSTPNLNVLTVAEPTETQQAQIDALNAAQSVSLSAGETVTVAQAEALSALEGFDGVYTLSDSAEHLAAADLALLEGAAEVEVTGTATVAEAEVLTALANIATDGNDLADVAITDTAANLAEASADLLDNVADITITDGEVSASQATALQALIANSDVKGLEPSDTFTVVDTQANLVASTNAAGVAGADTVEVSDVITLTQARAVIAATNSANISYNLVGTRSELQSATSTEAGYATKVNVTDTVTASQADIINMVYAGDSEVTFAQVQGNYAELTDNTNELIGQAQQVDLTDALTVEQLEGVDGFLNIAGDKLVGGYEVADTVDSIVNAALNTEFSAAIVENASNVTLTDDATMNIAAAKVINSLNFSGDYNIEDTATAIEAADTALINGADNVTVNLEAGVAETFDATAFTSNVTLDFSANQATVEAAQDVDSDQVIGLDGVDVVQVKDIQNADNQGDVVQLTAGADASYVAGMDGALTKLTDNGQFGVLFGYRTGDGFTISDTLKEDMLVVYQAGGEQYAVLFDGLPTVKIEDTYIVNDGNVDELGIPEDSTYVTFGDIPTLTVQEYTDAAPKPEVFDLVDDLSDPLSPEAEAAVTAATTVESNTVLNVTEATAIATLRGDLTDVTFDLVDNETGIFAGDANATFAATAAETQAAVAAADTVSVTGALNVAQAALIEGARADNLATVTFDLADAEIGIFTADATATFEADAATAVAAAGTVSVTGALNVAQVEAIQTARGGNLTDVTYSLSDEADNIVDADGTNLSSFVGADTDVTVTTAATVAQLDAIDLAQTGSGTLSYTAISDELASIIGENDGGSAILADAQTITASDVSGGTELTLDVTAGGPGTELNFGGSTVVGPVSLTQDQLAAIEGATATIDIVNEDFITVTGVTTSADDFANAAAIDLLDDNDTIEFDGGTAILDSVNFDAVFNGNGVDSTAGDTITVNGTASADAIDATGQAADFVLNGLGDNDIITGGNGADIITGGEGADTINGGAGADTYVFTDSLTVDSIASAGFTAGASGDIIDVSGLSLALDSGSIFTDSSYGGVAPSAFSVIALTNNAVGDAAALKVALDGNANWDGSVHSTLVAWEIDANNVGVAHVVNDDTDGANNDVTVTQLAEITGFADQTAVDSFTAGLSADNFNLTIA